MSYSETLMKVDVSEAHEVYRIMLRSTLLLDGL